MTSRARGDLPDCPSTLVVICATTERSGGGCSSRFRWSSPRRRRRRRRETTSAMLTLQFAFHQQPPPPPRPPAAMMSIKTLAFCLAAVLAVSATNGDVARNLRAQHDSGTPHAHGGDSTQNVAPGTSTTNVNITPGTVNTNINFTPGTSTTTVSGVPAPAVAAPAPPLVMPAPAPMPMAAPAPAPVPKPAAGGLNFGSLLGGGGGNPLTGAATMAHVAHGALLGHTGTVPSPYMQGQSGGGHGH